MVVFTPAGEPVKLPAGSTAVDFAYAVSPATADSAVGVLDNGMRKPMENRLAHGQVVDLITGPYADPPDSWLAAAHSGHARAHLKAAMARRQAEEAAALGRAAVAKAISAQGASRAPACVTSKTTALPSARPAASAMSTWMRSTRPSAAATWPWTRSSSAWARRPLKTEVRGHFPDRLRRPAHRDRGGLPGLTG